jgi:hypothetical protein
MPGHFIEIRKQGARVGAELRKAKLCLAIWRRPIDNHLAASGAAVAKQVRVGGSPVSRAVSYSGVGNLARTAGSRRDVHVGQANADFVGYVDGKSMFINSSNMVLSKDFSGCLMVAYTLASQRRVAHVAASHSPKWDCKQVFLNTLRKNGGSLLGWFRPYEEVYDVNAKLATYQVISTYIGGNINKLITFGAIDAADQGYAIDAFKPVGVAGNDWVVTRARLKQMSSAWNV